MSSSGWVPEPTANAERVWTARAVDSAAMRQRGAEVASVVRAGDVLVIDGPLGAGKTTFVQGLAAALGVRGAVTSPTFVISRVHRGPRVDLVHVDAYRLSGALELDDLDLDAEVAESVTVIEWGSGKAEELAEDRLHIVIISQADDALNGAGTATGHNPTDCWQWEHGAADAGRGRLPTDQDPTDQDPTDQDPTDQDPTDFGPSDASAGVRVIRVHGVGPRWAQLRL